MMVMKLMMIFFILTLMMNRERKQNGRSHNGRFGKIAALPPQTILCEIARLSPAGTLVKPLPRQAAGTLEASLADSAFRK
jgi:hypothetical protein